MNVMICLYMSTDTEEEGSVESLETLGLRWTLEACVLHLWHLRRPWEMDRYYMRLSANIPCSDKGSAEQKLKIDIKK